MGSAGVFVAEGAPWWILWRPFWPTADADGLHSIFNQGVEQAQPAPSVPAAHRPGIISATGSNAGFDETYPANSLGRFSSPRQKLVFAQRVLPRQFFGGTSGTVGTTQDFGANRRYRRVGPVGPVFARFPAAYEFLARVLSANGLSLSENSSRNRGWGATMSKQDQAVRWSRNRDNRRTSR